MNLRNLLKFRAKDSINIVYFKGREKAHSFYLPYKLFSTIKITLIVCLIWLPISIVLLYSILTHENTTTLALSKSKEALLNYQDKIDGIFNNLYAEEQGSSSTQNTDTNTESRNIQEKSLSFSTPNTKTLAENPIDIELNYNKIDDSNLNVDIKIINKNPSLSYTTGRILIALKLVNNNDETTYVLYPKDIISSVIPHVRKGESYKISRFKEINHSFYCLEGYSPKSIKVMVYNNQSLSSVEKEIQI